MDRKRVLEIALTVLVAILLIVAAEERRPSGFYMVLRTAATVERKNAKFVAFHLPMLAISNSKFWNSGPLSGFPTSKQLTVCRTLGRFPVPIRAADKFKFINALKIKHVATRSSSLSATASIASGSHFRRC